MSDIEIGLQNYEDHCIVTEQLQVAELIYIARKEIQQLRARNAVMLRLLILRDGGGHDTDCRAHQGKSCRCGHSEVATFLKEDE